MRYSLPTSSRRLKAHGRPPDNVNIKPSALNGEWRRIVGRRLVGVGSARRRSQQGDRGPHRPVERRDLVERHRDACRSAQTRWISRPDISPIVAVGKEATSCQGAFLPRRRVAVRRRSEAAASAVQALGRGFERPSSLIQARRNYPPARAEKATPTLWQLQRRKAEDGHVDSPLHSSKRHRRYAHSRLTRDRRAFFEDHFFAPIPAASRGSTSRRRDRDHGHA